MSSSKIVHVAVAVIKNSHGQLFISKRHNNAHQGGLWEFPGGKVENTETALEALKRELIEEIGITLIQASPLIRIHHDYKDKSVLLDVWCIDEFEGEAFGKEGQETGWVKQDELRLYKFPAANLAIIKAIQLPSIYMITGEFIDEYDLITRIQTSLNNGIKLIQFRANHLDENIYFEYAKIIFTCCENKNAKLLLNTSNKNYKKYKASKFSHGLHLNSKEIKLFAPCDKDEGRLISTSTHNDEEIRLAENKNVDFVLLSPVKKTLSHPDLKPLGWNKFKQLTDSTNVPVYALGGMSESDLKTSKEHGGQGVAAIGAFWNV